MYWNDGDADIKGNPLPAAGPLTVTFIYYGFPCQKTSAGGIGYFSRYMARYIWPSCLIQCIGLHNTTTNDSYSSRIHSTEKFPICNVIVDDGPAIT